MDGMHPLELVSVGLGSGAPPEHSAKGGASHWAKGSAEALARKYTLETLARLPENLEASLKGASVPSAEIFKETIEHRFVIHLHCTGHTVREISEKTDFSETHVRTILNQPWARKQVTRFSEEGDVKEKVQQMFVTAAADSVQTMIELRDNPKTPHSVRAKICNDLLNRVFGMPNQPLSVPVAVESSDADLAARLDELEARQRDLIGRPKVREVSSKDLTLVEIDSNSAA